LTQKVGPFKLLTDIDVY